jgi:hypothetical protein
MPLKPLVRICAGAVRKGRPYRDRLLCPRSQGAAARTANGYITSVPATTDVDKPPPNAYNLTMISSDFHPTRWSILYGQ